MAAAYDDSALRAELQGALSTFDQEVRGLQNMSAIVVSSSAKIAISTQLDMRTRRRALIQALLAALNAVSKARADLAADGYPDMPKATVEDAVLKAMQDTENDLTVAAALFGATSAPPQDQATISQLDINMKSNLAALSKAIQPGS